MKLLVKKQPNLILPSYANNLDAGADLYATTDPIIVAPKESVIGAKPLEDAPTFYRRVSYIQYGTNLYVTPEFRDGSYDFHIEIFPRSSICNKNLMLKNSTAIIDVGYQGQIMLNYAYLFQPEDFLWYRDDNGNHEWVARINQDQIYHRNDKIAQMQARSNDRIEFELVDELPKTDERGTGSFGSSDKKI